MAVEEPALHGPEEAAQAATQTLSEARSEASTQHRSARLTHRATSVIQRKQCDTRLC
jgi:hypothetical protein